MRPHSVWARAFSAFPHSMDASLQIVCRITRQCLRSPPRAADKITDYEARAYVCVRAARRRSPTFSFCAPELHLVCSRDVSESRTNICFSRAIWYIIQLYLQRGANGAISMPEVSSVTQPMVPPSAHSQNNDTIVQ